MNIFQKQRQWVSRMNTPMHSWFILKMARPKADCHDISNSSAQRHQLFSEIKNRLYEKGWKSELDPTSQKQHWKPGTMKWSSQFWGIFIFSTKCYTLLQSINPLYRQTKTLSDIKGLKTFISPHFIFQESFQRDLYQPKESKGERRKSSIQETGIQRKWGNLQDSATRSEQRRTGPSWDRRLRLQERHLYDSGKRDTLLTCSNILRDSHHWLSVLK